MSRSSNADVVGKSLETSLQGLPVSRDTIDHLLAPTSIEEARAAARSVLSMMGDEPAATGQGAEAPLES